MQNTTRHLAFVVTVIFTACTSQPPASEPPAAQGLAESQTRGADAATSRSTDTGAGADATPTASGSTTAPAAASPSAAAGLGSAAGLAAAPATSPAAPPVPAHREVVIPAGTVLKVRLATDLASDASQVEDTVRATLTAPVSVSGDVAIPDGATLRGSVVSVQQSGKVKGRASLAFRFEQLAVGDEQYDVRTERISRLARATKRQDATKVGVGAGAGALIGAIAGGGKGAAIGSAVGAGAGGGVVMATRGEEVRLPAGTAITTTLTAPVTVRVAVR